VRGDGRSRRVMIVPDAFLNPAAGDDPLIGLADAGWGIVALPQPGLPAHVQEAALAAVVDQLTAFLDDGYEVALADPLDPMAARLEELLRDHPQTPFSHDSTGVAERRRGGAMPKHSKARERLEGNPPANDSAPKDPRLAGGSQDTADPRAKNTQHRKKTADKWNQ
jgi:hypothetical protein